MLIFSLLERSLKHGKVGQVYIPTGIEVSLYEIVLRAAGRGNANVRSCEAGGKDCEIIVADSTVAREIARSPADPPGPSGRKARTRPPK